MLPGIAAHAVRDRVAIPLSCPVQEKAARRPSRRLRAGRRKQPGRQPAPRHHCRCSVPSGPCLPSAHSLPRLGTPRASLRSLRGPPPEVCAPRKRLRARGAPSLHPSGSGIVCLTISSWRPVAAQGARTTRGRWEASAPHSRRWKATRGACPRTRGAAGRRIGTKLDAARRCLSECGTPRPRRRIVGASGSSERHL